MEIEIDPADRARSIVLAENYRNLFIQSDSVPELGAPALVRLDRLVQQRHQRCFKVLRGFVDADDVSIVRFKRIPDF